MEVELPPDGEPQGTEECDDWTRLRALTETITSIPTKRGNMVKVDSKGRIVLPKEVRERLGITPGTEVDVHEEGGRAVVEPEDNPDEILERMDQLIVEFSEDRGDTKPLTDDVDPISDDFRETIRNGAKGEHSE